MKTKILIMFIALSALADNNGARAQGYHYDVNNNGVVDITDAVLVIDHILGKNSPAEAVDLGLPSGTKWASYNVGASKPEEFGSYYAWGETEEKEDYSWETYIHCDGSSYTCHSLGKDISGTEYDVAHVKWGGNWCMPSDLDIFELLDNCIYELTTLNGVKGGKFTGPNGNSIFLPAAGDHRNDRTTYVGEIGYYWSSSQIPQYCYNAFMMAFTLGYTFPNYTYCFHGANVRPIIHSTPALAISNDAVSMKVGESTTIEVTSGSSNYTVESADGSIATASIQGKRVSITAVNTGTVTITVFDTQSGMTASIIVTVTKSYTEDVPAEAIDLGLPSGTKWASYNVGASKPEEYGGCYAWGETEEKENYSWKSYIHCDGDIHSCHDLGVEFDRKNYDVAFVKWGGKWRIPTVADVNELNKYCKFEWTTLNGVKGGKFTGPNGNSIFLPAAGYRWGGSLNNVGEGGYYWTSTMGPDEDDLYYAFDIFFNSDTTKWYGLYQYRGAGLCVRPVVSR